mmetsp:Transcript_37477/g.110699  ORF Transcript_37477/g.110699 Transcript_37477/m.110699 type:complete len:141 (-) Transcript_37477:325-747(-)
MTGDQNASKTSGCPLVHGWTHMQGQGRAAGACGNSGKGGRAASTAALRTHDKAKQWLKPFRAGQSCVLRGAATFATLRQAAPARACSEHSRPCLERSRARSETTPLRCSCCSRSVVTCDAPHPALLGWRLHEAAPTTGQT